MSSHRHPRLRRPTSPSRGLRAAILGLALGILAGSACAQDPPDVPAVVLDPALGGYAPVEQAARHDLPLEKLRDGALFTAESGGDGIALDLGDPELHGQVYTGAFYYGLGESRVVEPRYRRYAPVSQGRCVLPVGDDILAHSQLGHPEAQGQGVLAYRLELWRQDSQGVHPLGYREGRVHFRRVAGRNHPMLSIVEGPTVALVQSDHPDWLVIGLAIDRPARAWVEVEGLGRFSASGEGRRHEIRVEGLTPARAYRYRAAAQSGETIAWTPWLELRSAGAPGEGEVRFVYAGDSRGAPGGALNSYLGVNKEVLSELAHAAVRHDADFLLFGGDLITGHVGRVEDFVAEMQAFKQCIRSFTTGAPLFTAMGNHESLYRFYERRGQTLYLDRWPYATESAEALFAKELIQPTDGPTPQAGFPPYDEIIFSFQRGPVRVLVCNNNYWTTPRRWLDATGGSPEGYMMPEQLEWIRERLDEAERDPTVRYVFLVLQEPVFPTAGHVSDAMWWGGDNRVRARRNDGGELRDMGPGVIEVRNQLWRMASQSSKVAAVLCSDEHNYQRVLITSETPVGIPELDDLDGDGRLNDRRTSPDESFRNPTWTLVSGGAGAPYYAQETAPWSLATAKFSTQNHYLVLHATDERVSLEAWNLHGDLLDRVDDLMSVKKEATR